jgi:hypothetical protein
MAVTLALTATEPMLVCDMYIYKRHLNLDVLYE